MGSAHLLRYRFVYFCIGGDNTHTQPIKIPMVPTPQIPKILNFSPPLPTLNFRILNPQWVITGFSDVLYTCLPHLNHSHPADQNTYGAHPPNPENPKTPKPLCDWCDFIKTTKMNPVIKRKFASPTLISKHLVCTICQEVFSDPVRVSCG